MQNISGIPKYVSPEQYSKQSGLGVERIKELCNDGKLPCEITSGGHYKIKIYEDAVPIEEYKKLEKKYNQLEAAIQTIHVASSIWKEGE